MDKILGQIVNTEYIDKYNNLLLNDNKIIKTDNLLDIFKINSDKSLKEDIFIKNQLNDITSMIQTINNKFADTYNLCNEYIDYYDKTKEKTTEMYGMFDKSILSILEKNKKYNEMVDKLLEEHKKKFNEISKNIIIKHNHICIDCLKEFPKNQLVQLIVSMIILQDCRNKTNIKFKQNLISEIEMQKVEINEQIRIIDKLSLNCSVFDECFNMEELVNNIEKKTNI